MENNKQVTAVKWLESEMLKLDLSMHEIIEQAKEMEKQQIIVAFHKQTQKFYCEEEAEQYYKETFNK